MDSNHPPLPPQPPAMSAEAASSGEIYTYRYTWRGREVVIRVAGGVAVVGETELDFGAGARAEAEVRDRHQSERIVWDRGGCTVRRSSGVAACTASERELVVSGIRQRPSPPQIPGRNGERER